MAVGAVGNGSTPALPGSDDTAQLQRQKERLQKQLEAVKSKPKNSQAEEDAAVQQIRQLERKIAEIDQKIQNQPQNQQQGQKASAASAVNSEKSAARSKRHSMPANVQNEQSASPNVQQDKTPKATLSDTGELLNVYA